VRAVMSLICGVDRGQEKNQSTRHKHSRKGEPWLPEEEELLVESRRNRGLPWSTGTHVTCRTETGIDTLVFHRVIVAIGRVHDSIHSTTTYRTIWVRRTEK
jgi:hypothetical protein